MALLSHKCLLKQLSCRVVGGRRVALVANHKSLQILPVLATRRAHVLAHAAAVVESTAQSSFTTLLDDEDEFEYDGGEDFDDFDEAEQPTVDPTLLVENLGLSEETIMALKRRGINALFPIQGLVLRPAMEGQDLICRAKTGSGKTLAFALPVVESLLTEDTGSSKSRRASGRTPRCLIMAPTRELAKQVAAEFESVCPSLKVLSIYGGTSINVQIGELRRGVDVVVGTPGRIMDLLERKALAGDKVRFVVLDEADQMLDMGFEEDMEVILQQMPQQRQTMLFSATLPHWVNKVARRYQQNPATIDLVGDDQTGKLNEDVTLNIMQVAMPEKKQALLDLLNVYAAGGKAIVFTKTKVAADEVASVVSQQHSCEALHGDIAQAQREKTLGRFRSGDVTVLIATDVAARGLDIPNVDLVVHFDYPTDSEAFLHRSGRTGRAGNKGRAIVLHTPGETRALGQILQQVKLTSGDVIGAPSPADVMSSASKTVLTKLDRVEPSVIDFFMPAAERLIASPQPERVLAAALAAMSGFRNVVQERSLLTGEVGMSTLKLEGPASKLDGYTSAARFLERLLNRNLGAVIGRVRIMTTPGQEGVAVDLPSEEAAAVLAAAEDAAKMGVQVSKPATLPLDVKDMVLGRRGGRPPHSDRSLSPRGSFRGSRGGNFNDSRGPRWGGGQSRGGWGNSREDYGRSSGRDNFRGGDQGQGQPWSGRGRQSGSGGSSSGGSSSSSWGDRSSNSSRGGRGGGGSSRGGRGGKGAIW